MRSGFLCVLRIYTSINSKREHPLGKPQGFFEVVKSLAVGQNFPAKAQPPGQKHSKYTKNITQGVF